MKTDLKSQISPMFSSLGAKQYNRKGSETLVFAI